MPVAMAKMPGSVALETAQRKLHMGRCAFTHTRRLFLWRERDKYKAHMLFLMSNHVFIIFLTYSSYIEAYGGTEKKQSAETRLQNHHF